MDEHENRQIVERAYANFKAGEIDKVLQATCKDVRWETPDIENVRFSGKRQGRDEVGDFFSTLAKLMDARSFEPGEYIARGDKVVVLGHYVWQVKENGRTIASDFAHVFTLRGGEIAGFHEYTDSAAIANAFRSK